MKTLTRIALAAALASPSLGASAWFEVDRGAIAPPIHPTGPSIITTITTTTTTTTTTTASPWDQMLQAYGASLAAQEQARQRRASGPAGLDGDSTWVRELGWAAHFEGFDLADLFQAGAGPALKTARGRLTDPEAQKAEALYSRLGASFDRLTEQALDRVHGGVPHETRKWLASTDANKPAPQPFGRKEDPTTVVRYSGLWKQFLCFGLRAYRLGRTGAQARYRLQTTDAQWQQLARVACLAEKAQASHQDLTKLDVELDQAVLAFCLGALQQKVYQEVYSNPLLLFAAILGIDGRRVRWRQARHYTPRLAGLLWCSRLLLLEHSFRDVLEVDSYSI